MESEPGGFTPRKPKSRINGNENSTFPQIRDDEKTAQRRERKRITD
jgi:hypothetical protein